MPAAASSPPGAPGTAGAQEASAGQDDVVDDPVVAGLGGGEVVVAVDVRATCSRGRPVWWAMISDMRRVSGKDLAQLDLHVRGAPREPAEPS